MCWLHLLFEFCNHDEIMGNLEKHELAYVQWFHKRSHHRVNKILIVEITEKFDVIWAEGIYHPIHLIPKNCIILDLKTTAANHIASENYQEYYVNSYVDHHALTNCY